MKGTNRRPFIFLPYLRLNKGYNVINLTHRKIIKRFSNPNNLKT